MTNLKDFVDSVLQMYLSLADTPDRFNKHDSHIAEIWFDEGVTLQQVHQATLLAQVRRGFRFSDDEPLNPIRSLHYFAPIIKEVQRSPMDEKYFRYLQRKVKDLNNQHQLDAARSNSSGSP